jgi:hypothetical protein
MSVQDDKRAGQEEDRQLDDKDAGQEEGQQLTEKPEPDEEQKEKAAKMMEAYEDQPTLVLPGTGGMVSGTAVNEWLDEDGNPKQESPDDVGRDDAGSDGKPSDQKQPRDKGEDDQGEDDQGVDKLGTQEQIDKDKARNEELKKVAAEENKGEKG